MKNCDKCRHMYDAGGEYAVYVCDLFGEDVPSEFATEDGCCLHQNEVKKAIRLRDRALSWTFIGYSHEPTENEKRLLQKTAKEYNDYLEHLRKKYGGANES